MASKRKINKGLKEEILEKYHKGENLDLIAEEFEIPVVVLKQWIYEESLGFFIRTITKEEDNGAQGQFFLKLRTVLTTKIKINKLVVTLILCIVEMLVIGILCYIPITDNYSKNIMFKLDSLIDINKKMEEAQRKTYNLTKEIKDSINIHTQPYKLKTSDINRCTTLKMYNRITNKLTKHPNASNDTTKALPL